MIFGEGARANQAHLAADNVPQLRQFIDTEPAQQSPNYRYYPRVVYQLHVTMPFAPQIIIASEPFCEQCFGVRIHGAQLPHFELLAAQANAVLGKECGTRAYYFNQRNGQPDNW